MNDLIGSLSTRNFETRTVNERELFSLITCLHTTTFTLLTTFSPLAMISIKILETPMSLHAKCSLWVAVRVLKTRVLKFLWQENGNVQYGQTRTNPYYSARLSVIIWRSHPVAKLAYGRNYNNFLSFNFRFNWTQSTSDPVHAAYVRSLYSSGWRWLTVLPKILSHDQCTEFSSWEESVDHEKEWSCTLLDAQQGWNHRRYARWVY